MESSNALCVRLIVRPERYTQCVRQEHEKQREKMIDREDPLACVCVCVRERERERERKTNTHTAERKGFRCRIAWRFWRSRVGVRAKRKDTR